jgi:hypothetical protein
MRNPPRALMALAAATATGWAWAIDAPLDFATAVQRHTTGSLGADALAVTTALHFATVMALSNSATAPRI